MGHIFNMLDHTANLARRANFFSPLYSIWRLHFLACFSPTFGSQRPPVDLAPWSRVHGLITQVLLRHVPTSKGGHFVLAMTSSNITTGLTLECFWFCKQQTRRIRSNLKTYFRCTRANIVGIEVIIDAILCQNLD